jgi:hypothetical protein
LDLFADSSNTAASGLACPKADQSTSRMQTEPFNNGNPTGGTAASASVHSFDVPEIGIVLQPGLA